jgi:hypothetical protein
MDGPTRVQSLILRLLARHGPCHFRWVYLTTNQPHVLDGCFTTTLRPADVLPTTASEEEGFSVEKRLYGARDIDSQRIIQNPARVPL